MIFKFFLNAFNKNMSFAYLLLDPQSACFCVLQFQVLYCNYDLFFKLWNESKLFSAKCCSVNRSALKAVHAKLN